MEELSPCTTTTEPMLYRPAAETTQPTCHNYWKHAPRARAPQETPSAARSLSTATGPSTDKINSLKFLKNLKRKHTENVGSHPLLRSTLLVAEGKGLREGASFKGSCQCSLMQARSWDLAGSHDTCSVSHLCQCVA